MWKTVLLARRALEQRLLLDDDLNGRFRRDIRSETPPSPSSDEPIIGAALLSGRSRVVLR